MRKVPPAARCVGGVRSVACNLITRAIYQNLGKHIHGHGGLLMWSEVGLVTTNLSSKECSVMLDGRSWSPRGKLAASVWERVTGTTFDSGMRMTPEGL